MKNSKLRYYVLLLAMLTLSACSNKHKQGPENASSTGSRPPEHHPGDSEGGTDHSVSPNNDEVNKCLKNFFSENTATIENALAIGAMAIRDCKAKPGDIVMFVQINFQ